MNTCATSINARLEKADRTRPTNKSRTGPAAPPARASPNERLLQRRYRVLIRKHLSHMLERLFAEFTGLHFRTAWALGSPGNPHRLTPPTCRSVCCRLRGSTLFPECRACGPNHLPATLQSVSGHRFTCRLGVRNCWVPLRVRSLALGIAYLQALEHPVTSRLARSGGGRAPVVGYYRSHAVGVGELEFARAAGFLRHIVQHVQTASLSDLRLADLSSAGRAVVAMEREQARLHETLHRYLPAVPPAPRSSGPESRAGQVVHGLLERVELDYASPIKLERFARDLGMNATYLSALFSRVVGTPFKSYLTALRLQKARELLGDSGKTAGEVAVAVGYSSEDRFRSAFKKATGLAPKMWRERMQTQPPARID